MDDASLNGYLAFPRCGAGLGVVCLHAWWGLNPFFKGFCDCLANEGFVVLAPDLYNEKVATTIDEAGLLRGKLKKQKTYLDLLGVIDSFHGLDTVTGPSIGMIGFSLGARFALELSTKKSRNINPVVVFLWKQQCRLLVFPGSISLSLRRK